MKQNKLFLIFIVLLSLSVFSFILGFILLGIKTYITFDKDSGSNLSYFKLLEELKKGERETKINFSYNPFVLIFSGKITSSVLGTKITIAELNFFPIRFGLLLLIFFFPLLFISGGVFLVIWILQKKKNNYENYERNERILDQ